MTILRRPQARRDLIDLADQLDRAWRALGDRFLNKADSTFVDLEKTPDLGAPVALSHPRLAGLLHYPVNGFRNHIIYYLATREGIEIVRILHGANDSSTSADIDP